jgi:methyl-accepting chemotaxis protein
MTVEEERIWKDLQKTWRAWEEPTRELRKVIEEKDRLLASGLTKDDPRVLAQDDRTIELQREIQKHAPRVSEGLAKVTQINKTDAAALQKEVEASSSRANVLLGVGVAIAAAALLLVGWLLSRTIAGIIAGLVREAARITDAVRGGKLTVRGDPAAVNFEFRAIVQGMNETLDAYAKPIAVTAEYVTRISKGDVPARIEERYEGDFDGIKQGLNRCIDAVNGVISEMSRMSVEHDKGDIDVVVDAARFEGAWRTVAQGVNDMVAGHIAVKKKAMACVAEFGRGNFEAPLEKFPGKKAFINETVEQVRANLKALIADADRLATAAVEGKLSTRADAAKHQGDFRKIVDGVNRTLDAVVAPLQEAAEVLDRLAKRDLRARVKGAYQGDHARIKEALNSTAEALHEALAQVAQAVEQVSSASGQIAAGSQAVADGAAEQASSLEETSSQLQSMASMAKGTADNAQQANLLATQARSAATEGAAAMEQMGQAMGKIRASAEGTSQIIKDINEIAFQTNLLALNAAVEAARAGEAGRGFAVVAEEVRSLALRSKDAANKTEELIRQSVKEAGEGEVTSGQVSAKLGEIVASIAKVSDVVAEISAAAKEQTVGIDQIGRAVSQMDKVTQQNAASSEESSSAAAELSGQSEELAAMVGSFQLERVKAARPAPVAAAPAAKPAATKRNGHANGHANGAKLRPEQVIPLDDADGFEQF